MLQVLPGAFVGANFIAAVTLQAMETGPNTASDSVGHFTCFADKFLSLSKEECCTELSKHMSELCKLNKLENRLCEKDGKSYQYFHHCNQVIAAVPPFKIYENHHGDESTDPSPRYYMNMPVLDILDELNSFANYRFYQHVMHGSTPSLHKKEPVYSPFHASPLHLAEETNGSQRERPVGTVKSVLSDEGGMHRPFRHVITLLQAGDYRFGERFFGNIELVLPISGDFFIDLDMPFQEDIEDACHFRYTTSNAASDKVTQPGTLSEGTRCYVDAIVAPNSNIDIEQPSFVSPQHVVLLYVSFEFDALGIVPTSLEMDFTTILHVRYPMPISRDEEEIKPGFIAVDVSPAYLYRGFVQTRRGKDKDTSDEHYLLNTAYIATELSDETWKQNILSMEIAAGRDEHYDIVVFVTVFISIIGAFSMLQDLSKAAVWC